MVNWSDSQSSSADCADGTPARFFKQATGPEISLVEFGILEDDRCIDTGVFQQCYLLHELVFACSSPPPQQPQISCTILSTELGLLPVVNTGNGGTRVLVRTVGRAMRSNKLFCQGSKFIPIIRTGVQCHGQRGRVGQQTLSAASNKGIMERHAASRLGFRKWTTTRLLLTQCRFSRVFICRSSSSPVPALAASLWEYLEQSQLAFREPPFCRSWRLSLTRDVAAAGRAGQESAPRRALPRPHGQGGCACALVWHAFASLDLEQPFCPKAASCSRPRAQKWSGCHGKGKEAGQQMLCVAWIQIVLLWVTANRKSAFPGH